jgi:hypothetical protein
MDMNTAKISHGWELHVVYGHLFITSEEDADVQVRLDAYASIDLLVYLYKHKDEFYQAMEREIYATERQPDKGR